MIVILGAGLAGLSAAYHLERECVVLEREETPGGLCRSTPRNGFDFGYSGHLLHVRDPEVRRMLADVLPEPWPIHERRAFVRSHGALVPFPFQIHLGELPPAVRAECVIEYSRVQRRPAGALPGGDAALGDWILRTYGKGIARHFFVPYHRKLWGDDLDELLVEEVRWSIPEAEPEAVIRGVLGLETSGLGYSAVFQHPSSGGIGVLGEALTRAVETRRPGTLRLGDAVVSVDLAGRSVTTARGSRFEFEALVSTLPVPELVAISTQVPATLQEKAQALRYRSVACVNLGFARERLVDWHWLYVPEPELPFFRIGCYSNFSEAPGSSFYVEFARPGGTPVAAGLIEEALAGMRRLGIIGPRETACAAEVVDLPYAYVVHDRHRAGTLPGILDFFARHGVHGVGRYGGWGYLSMEGSLRAGRQAAEALA